MADVHEEALTPERMKAELAAAQIRRRAALLAQTKRRWPTNWLEWLPMGLSLVFFLLAFRIYDRLPSPDLKDVWSAAWMVASGFTLLIQVACSSYGTRIDALAELIGEQDAGKRPQ